LSRPTDVKHISNTHYQAIYDLFIIHLRFTFNPSTKHKKMEDTLVLKKNEIFGDKYYDSELKGNQNSNDRIGNYLSSASLLSECGLNFFLYLRSLNFSDEKEFIVLPSDHHFFYDVEELKNVRVLINLKRLNLIKQPDRFLDTLVRILPVNASFVGCFSDSKSVNREISILNRYSVLCNRFLNFLDSRTDKTMDKNAVSDLLGRRGFQTLDMREINGLTYFYCKKAKPQEESPYLRKIG